MIPYLGGRGRQNSYEFDQNDLPSDWQDIQGHAGKQTAESAREISLINRGSFK